MASSIDDIRASLQNAESQLNPEGGAPPPEGLEDISRTLASATLEATPAGVPGRQDPFEPDLTRGLSDEFVAGLGAGVDSLQMALYGIARQVGRDLDLPDLEDYGTEGIRGNIAEIQQFGPSVSGFTDIESADDFFRWSAGALGQAVPSLGAAMTGGGIGAVLGKKAVERAIRNKIQNAAIDDLVRIGIKPEVAVESVFKMMRGPKFVSALRQSLTTAEKRALSIGSQAGAAAGATGVSVPQQTGETLTSGVDDLGTAIIAGIAGGALEALPALRLLKRSFPGTDPRIAGQFVQDFVKATGSQSLIEGSTEAAQEMIQLAAQAYHDPFFDLLDPHNAKQVIDSFAAGALVGAVTGGGAAGIGELTGAPRVPGDLPTIDETPIEPVTPPDDFEPADNTVLEEIRDRINSSMQESLAPALNTIRNQFTNGVRGIVGAVPGLGKTLGAYTKPVKDAHDEFVAGHANVIEDAQRYAQESMAWITEQAEKISNPEERAAFIQRSLAEVQEQFTSLSEDLVERAGRILQRTQSQVDGIGVFDTEDDQTLGVDSPETEFTFGQNESFVDEQGVKRTRRTKGDDVIPFETERGALNAVASLLNRFPNAAESAFEVRQVEDGWVVAIDDSGQRDTMIQDEIISDAVDNARWSARGNPDRKGRQVQVQMKGVEGKTFLDIPTLIFAAKKLIPEPAGRNDRPPADRRRSIPDAVQQVPQALSEAVARVSPVRRGARDQQGLQAACGVRPHDQGQRCHAG
jgi:hypothetical protein